MALATFLASTAGRAVRIVAGLALISIGILVVGGIGGYVLTAIPVLGPVLNLLAVLLGLGGLTLAAWER